MSVRVIKTEPAQSVVREAICGGCGATLSYIPNDVKQRDYTDISQVTETIYWIVCPQCNKEVSVKRP